jgi:hypothetical protein
VPVIRVVDNRAAIGVQFDLGCHGAFVYALGSKVLVYILMHSDVTSVVFFVFLFTVFTTSILLKLFTLFVLARRGV